MGDAMKKTSQTRRRKQCPVFQALTVDRTGELLLALLNYGASTKEIWQLLHATPLDIETIEAFIRYARRIERRNEL